MPKKKPSRLEVYKRIRKPLPKPAAVFKSKKAYNRKKEMVEIEESLKELREERQNRPPTEEIIPAGVIKKKRDGYPLSKDEIAFMIKGMLSGNIPPYQITALLMAIYFKGMDRRETIDLTKEIITSGRPLDLSHIPMKKVDKHSTGGVGDKVSLCLAPLVAGAGVCCPMVSGRALGHTGGTLDKLESIPKFRTYLDNNSIIKQLSEIGVVMAGQTEEIAPADRALYALRDVTATVDCVPLIASSIMGKKLSEGIDGLCLDVKVGNGAFMKDMKRAKELAGVMVEIGRGMGKEVTALLTDMDQPLGRAIGNALEVKEAIELLKGDREGKDDLWEVTRELGAWMLKIGGKTVSVEEGKAMMEMLLEEGRGLAKFKEIIKAQGGDKRVVDNPSLLPIAKAKTSLPIDEGGYINNMDTERIGWASVILGCGRRQIEDRIDPEVGIILHKKIGDFVEKGEPVFTIYHHSGQDIEVVKEYLSTSISCSKAPVEKKPLIKGIVKT